MPTRPRAPTRRAHRPDVPPRAERATDARSRVDDSFPSFATLGVAPLWIHHGARKRMCGELAPCFCGRIVDDELAAERETLEEAS